VRDLRDLDLWPSDEYTFRLPPCGIPLLTEHDERLTASSGAIPGDVGVARRFHEIPGFGIIVLMEVTVPSGCGILAREDGTACRSRLTWTSRRAAALHGFTSPKCL